MSDDRLGIISHVFIGTNDFDRAIAFYDTVLPSLGCRRIVSFPNAAAYGQKFPEFWRRVGHKIEAVFHDTARQN